MNLSFIGIVLYNRFQSPFIPSIQHYTWFIHFSIIFFLFLWLHFHLFEQKQCRKTLHLNKPWTEVATDRYCFIYYTYIPMLLLLLLFCFGSFMKKFTCNVCVHFLVYNHCCVQNIFNYLLFCFGTLFSRPKIILFHSLKTCSW